MEIILAILIAIMLIPLFPVFFAIGIACAILTILFLPLIVLIAIL
jgi:hypothetical protein